MEKSCGMILIWLPKEKTKNETKELLKEASATSGYFKERVLENWVK